MKDIKNFTVLFDLFTLEEIHLYKDVGMIPHYLSVLYGLETSIVCFEQPQNKNLPPEINKVKLIRIRNWLGILSKIPLIKKLRQFQIFAFIIKRARKMDALNLYHFTLHSILNGLLYKWLNPGGVLYLKMDDDLYSLKKYGTIRKPANLLFRSMVKHLEKRFLEVCDLISIETKEGEALIREHLAEYTEKLIYLPNGVDESYIEKNFQHIKSFKEKENIILTVGRIGSRQKNHEMLLESVAAIDLHDWKVCLVGKIEPSFQLSIDEYFRKNPELKSKIIFAGEVPERKDLYEWYNRAKVFCLTSDWESFGIVLTEAAYFGDYIISTNVGAAQDITAQGSIGKVIPIGASETLVEELQAIVFGKKSIGPLSARIHGHAAENFNWEKLAGFLFRKMRSV